MESTGAQGDAETLLSPEDFRARACAELRRGAPILMQTPGGGPAALILAAEMVSAATLSSVSEAASKALGTPPPALAISDRRAQTLKIRVYDGDLARVSLSETPDLRVVRAVADPAMDLDSPMLGPHVALRDGDPSLARAALALCKRAKLLPAAVIWTASDADVAVGWAQRAGLAIVDAEQPGAPDPGTWVEAVSARVPISVFPNTRLRLFRRLGWDDEHYALELGDPPRDAPVLTRLHSACATGDLFGSLKCDCGPQLHAALARIADEGAGVLVYLHQEGRGIGLANKLRAYRLQDQGFDTVDANHRLGFRDDERLLQEGGEILHAMGFREARLMTNNPLKVAALEAAGVSVVRREPLKVGETEENRRYLEVKAEKSGHIL